MPLISKGNPFDAYEGAIVLEPKTGLYLDNPVACVDYSSLYPSSIISENISHDSKVWTKEIDFMEMLFGKQVKKMKMVIIFMIIYLITNMSTFNMKHLVTNVHLHLQKQQR